MNLSPGLKDILLINVEDVMPALLGELNLEPPDLLQLPYPVIIHTRPSTNNPDTGSPLFLEGLPENVEE
jgi:hypothetical protein